MKKIVANIIFVVLSLSLSFSQNVTQVRKIKTKALEAYENYKYSISMLYQAKPGDNREDAFKKVFNEDALIYNDILPQNSPAELSPQQYCGFFESKFEYSPCGRYSSLELLFPTETKDGKWKIQVKFRRVMEFHTQQGFLYPKYEFSYIMTVLVDENFENTKIESINVSNPLNQFFVVKNPDLEYELEYDSMQINDWDEKTNSRIFNSQYFEIQKFKINNNHYFRISGLSKNQDDPHFYDVLQKRKNIFGVGINYTPWGFGNKIVANRFKGISMRSNTLALSLFYGLQIGKLPQRDNSTWFLNIGLDINRYQHKYIGSDYTEYHAVDADNDPYLRKIQINKLNEKINSVSSSLFLSVSYLWSLTKQKQNPVFLVFEAGAFAEYTFLSKSTYKINADYHGFYDQYYDGVEFDHYYDYGNFSQSSIQKLITVKNLRCDYGLWGSIGCCIALDKSNLLKVNIGYKHGFNTPIRYKESFVISENKDTYQSLLQSSHQGKRDLFLGISYMRTIAPKIK